MLSRRQGPSNLFKLAPSVSLMPSSYLWLTGRQITSGFFLSKAYYSFMVSRVCVAALEAEIQGVIILHH